MKKLLLILVVAGLIAGCGTSDETDKGKKAENRKSKPPQQLSLGNKRPDDRLDDAKRKQMEKAKEEAAKKEAAEKKTGGERAEYKPMINKGESVRQFSAKTIDGQKLNLADYKGKYVLIDFWATWCGPCRKELPYLLELHKTYGNRSDFAMVGVSLDRSDKALKKYIGENKIQWPNVLDSSKTGIAQLYGVKSIPFVVLIDPQGKVIATKLRGPALIKEVEGRLKAKGV